VSKSQEGKALVISIPPTLLALADGVIESCGVRQRPFLSR
jgi:hypothetical protein